MPDPVNPTTDAVPDAQRQSAFAALFNEHTPATPSPALAAFAEAAAHTAAGAAPTPAAAAAVRPRARRVSADDEAAASGRTKYTVYIDADRKRQFEALAEETFFDTRGAVTKSDVHDAIVAYGLAHAGAIVADLIRAASTR